METYFCMGTIYHILGYVQRLGNFEMNNYYYIESMIENYIDTFRYYHLFNEDMEYALIKMSKYIYRLYNAMNLITNNKYIEKEGIFNEILKNFKSKNSINNNNIKNKLYQLFDINNMNSEIILRKILNDINETLISINYI